MSEIRLTPQDRELIFELVTKLTGTLAQQGARHEIVITNVLRRMQSTGNESLLSYLNYISSNESELSQFISAVTIHTTSWFREMPHYRNLERDLLQIGSKLAGRRFRLFSGACSTGEELYSFGMILESFRRQYAGFEYELIGMDIDPLSVQKAETAFYKVDDIQHIPQQYRMFLLSRTKLGHNHFLVDPEIRRRTKLIVGNLLDSETFKNDPFDMIVCRNVLIYFQEEKIERIIANLLDVLKPAGTLTLGHCETIDSRRFGMVSLGNSSYRRPAGRDSLVPNQKGISVLCVDDSPWIRLWLTNVLTENDIKVHTAESAEAATEYLKTNSVDLITLDLNMPGQHGLSWLTDQRAAGLATPVIIFTDVNAQQAPEVLEALNGNAQDYVNKALLGGNALELVDRVQVLVRSYRSKQEPEIKPVTFEEMRSKHFVELTRPDVIVIGASTGGTDALTQVLSQMPPNCPPVVCVQHIPREFAAAFLDRLSKSSGLKPNSPEKGKELEPNNLYMPLLDAHIGLRINGDKIVCYYSHGDKLSGHRPSVDYLFQTASFLRDKKVLACLLTGMGRDGAQGLLELKRMGAVTLVQDQVSSVVWGMPGEAIRLGAAQVVGNLRELREIIAKAVRTPDKAATMKAS